MCRLDGDLRGGEHGRRLADVRLGLGQVGVERADVAADADLGVVQVELRLAHLVARDVERGVQVRGVAADRQLDRGALAVGRLDRATQRGQLVQDLRLAVLADLDDHLAAGDLALELL